MMLYEIYKKAGDLLMNVGVKCGTDRKPVRVMIVDDHEIIQRGLAEIFKSQADIKVCGFAGSVGQAVPMAGELTPDLMIVDLSLQHSADGLLLVDIARSRFPGIKILVLSMYEESIYAERARRVGASGYLMKEDMRKYIVTAVREIMGGRFFFNKQSVTSSDFNPNG